jgi:hypothetical protein
VKVLIPLTASGQRALAVVRPVTTDVVGDLSLQCLDIFAIQLEFVGTAPDSADLQDHLDDGADSAAAGGPGGGAAPEPLS